jgi:hypothetical protein
MRILRTGLNCGCFKGDAGIKFEQNQMKWKIVDAGSLDISLSR